MKRKPPPRKKAARSTGATPVRARAGLSPAGYGELLDELKTRVRAAQIKAAVAANRELIQLYWDIGRMIVERQERESWGKGRSLGRSSDSCRVCLARDIAKTPSGSPGW